SYFRPEAIWKGSAVTLQETHTPAEFEILDNETCLTALMDTAKARPHGVMFTRPANYEWVNVTAKEFIREVFDVAKGIIAAGVEQGDRIIIISETRYEWSFLDFAVWAAGAVSVPVYPSSSLSQVRWGVEDSGAVLAITESQDHTELGQHLLVDESGIPSLSGSTSPLRRILDINSAAVEALKFGGRSLPDYVVDGRLAAAATNDLASVVDTSGTTGKPKGCILTHKNWLAEVRGLLANPIGAIAVAGSRVLTFLPM